MLSKLNKIAALALILFAILAGPALAQTGSPELPAATLATFLASLAAGGGTFLAARWILEQLPGQGIQLTRQQRFFAVYALSFALAGGAFATQIGLGFAAFSWDGLFNAGVTAFAASQALWGAFMNPDPAPAPEPEKAAE